MFVTALAIILSFAVWIWATYLGWDHWTSLVILLATYFSVFWLRRKIFGE